MKKCPACAEDFADKFSFCPVDGTPLLFLAATVSEYSTARKLDHPPRQRKYQYNPTILSNIGLLKRLTSEIQFTVYRIKASWPDFKRDPIAAGKRVLVECRDDVLSARLASRMLAGSLTAISIVLSAVFLTWLLASRAPNNETTVNDVNVPEVAILTVAGSEKTKTPSQTGVGTGSNGRVGFTRGRGEGSKSETQAAHGGGSGGLGHKSPPQKGRPPQPSPIPALIPQLAPARKLTLPHSGIDIDPALWKQLQLPVYGDPRSNSTTPSNGPGNAGGMGTANGPGIGDGNGDGFGPGLDGNIGGGTRAIGSGARGGGSGNDPADPDRVLPASLVGQRARVLAKPEPQYTDEARRNQITGTVVLRVVFSRFGDVTNVRAVQSLPFGLTEKAIAAARQIRFLPAIKDGRPVSVYMQLEYNFNLY